jgi:hypothetical protein
MRVLVTGEACFRVRSDLEWDGVDVIGCAESVDEASGLLNSLRPDAVLLTSHSADDLQLLSAYVPVVVLAPSRDETEEEEHPSPREREVRLLQVALALASAMPSRRLSCLGSIAEE